jgi:hypothetical protein
MTKSTVNSGMSSCQWKYSGIMVEDSSQPVVHVVTNLAIGRELGSHMPFCPIILNLVAGNTIRLG